MPASLPPSPALPEQLSHAAVLAPAAQHWLLSPHRARERAAIIPGLYGFREGGEGSLTSLFPSLSPVLAWGPISVERRTSALQHGLRCFKSTRVSLGMAVKHWQQPCV